MAKHLHGPVPITILNGQTDSAPYIIQAALGSVETFMVFTPATLPETASLQVSPYDGVITAAVWYPPSWQPGAAAIALAALTAVNIPLMAGMRAIRFHSTTAVGADRTFLVTFQIDDDSLIGM